MASQRLVRAGKPLRDVGALAAVVVVLIATDVLLIDQNMWLTVPIACAASVVLIVIARQAGLTWTQLGLGRSRVRAGLRWGIAAAFLVAAGYVMVAVVPWWQSALDDDSMPTGVWEAVTKALVVIPLRTVVLEELAFRGVLWALLERRWGARQATLWSAALFGLWHVPAGLRLIDTNEALRTATAGSTLAAAGVVVGIVLFTAIAGVLFAEMRRRSGSLLAPAGLHWATNSFGTIVSAVK